VIRVGKETVVDSDPATLPVLGDNLGKALALEIDAKLFAGSGTSNQPKGFLYGTPINGTPTALQISGDAATPSDADPPCIRPSHDPEEATRA